MELTTIDACRVCGNTHLDSVFDIGAQYLQGSFVMDGMPLPTREKIPMELLRCDTGRQPGACGLVQLRHQVAPSVLYANYWYTSGTTATMTAHLRSIAASACQRAEFVESRVLDIGCNDGTLLANYPGKVEKWGIDPSDVATVVPESVEFVQDVFPSGDLRSRLGDRKFDVVTSIAMYYDLSDPVEFAREVEQLLAEDGIWIIEMSYLPMMLRMNSLDTVCHEHLEYYSLAVLDYIAKQVGMRIVDARLNAINGGSIQLLLCKESAGRLNESAEVLAKLRDYEIGIGLDTSRPLLDFRERVERQREVMIDLVNEIQDRGETIHVYGASTKGNVLIQWYGFDRDQLPFAADRNPKKVGARTVGTGIEIISEAESRAMRPDYYLVLPWHFRHEFLERERDTIMAGTRMIFPLPELLVVDADSFDTALESSFDYLEAFRLEVGLE
jgi:NDP-4-keto-2,6-dideoxyhexose 3-C-methyltransferase